jgi:protein required for attachment to host cells
MPTWVLVADAASARLYQSSRRPDGWTLVRELEHPQSRTRPSAVGADRPGRVKQSTGSRAAMEQPTPRKKVEADRFARELAHELEVGVDQGVCERLILVAPPSFIGFLRDKLAPRVQARVTRVLEKDYVHLDAPKLKERLEEALDAR